MVPSTQLCRHIGRSRHCKSVSSCHDVFVSLFLRYHIKRNIGFSSHQPPAVYAAGGLAKRTGAAVNVDCFHHIQLMPAVFHALCMSSLTARHPMPFPCPKQCHPTLIGLCRRKHRWSGLIVHPMGRILRILDAFGCSCSCQGAHDACFDQVKARGLISKSRGSVVKPLYSFCFSAELHCLA